MRVLFVGGQLDGQLQDVDQPLSPLVPTSINATLPNGIIVQYHVHFFQGEKRQYPLAIFEGLTIDDVFPMLLRWYAAKKLVKIVPTGEQPPAEQPPAEQPPAEQPSAESNIITP